MLEHKVNQAGQPHLYECKVSIKAAIESDNGKWKGVIKAGSHRHTYYEFTQDVIVPGKRHIKSLILTIFK